MDDDKYIMFFNTVQSGSLKTLTEAMKEVLNDITIYFTKDEIKIISMDGTKTTIVYLKLEGSQFEKYVCPSDIEIGVNMTSLYKLMKPINSSDTIKFYITKDQSNELVIQIENSEKITIDQSFLRLLDLDDDNFSIPPVEYDSIVSMPSIDFQRYCRDLSNISNTVLLKSYKDNDTHKFEMSCEGDFAKKKITIGSTCSNGLFFQQSSEATFKSASGIFALKYLLLFTKSTNLCSTVEVYLKDNFPLLLVYSVSNLGQIRYCLAPYND